MNETLELELARLFVAEYADSTDRIMIEHGEAMQCRACEEFLQRGIEAHRRLQLSEQTLRLAADRGLIEFSLAMMDTIERLYSAWLVPCEKAAARIQQLQERGFVVENAIRFLDCCEDVRGWLEDRDWHKRTAASRERILSSEPW